MDDPSSVQNGGIMKQSVCFSSQHSASGLIKKASGTNSSNSEFHREENTSKTLTKNIGITKNSIFNDSLDEDFQCSQLKNRINNAIKAKKKQEDKSFLCAVCNKDLTAANIDERAAHMNQCIDNQKLIDATCEASTSQTSSVFILDCPLCFKSFPSPELRSAHIKKCGKSRGLSIQSIVQAVQLQEKHALERRAMGLPLHRTNQLRQSKNNQGQSKKNPSRRLPVAPKSSLQSDIQLAKALSLSLKENESQSQQNFIQEVYPSLQPPSESQNPGRATTKRKQLNQLYPLLLRTEEEREKIIQDKINALVIRMDQSNKGSESPNQDSENEKVPFLWNLSGKSEDKSSYYVEQLLDWIMPSDVEIGSKLCNLSQIPGHRIFTQLPCDYTFSLDKTVDEDDKILKSSQLPSLLNSLQSLIGNSWMSDVDIYTASGIVIPAHKLILALRCSSLKDAFDDLPSSGKHILNWQDTSFDAALHFLNFLYTGTTEWKDDIFDELFQLAKKYEVKDLLFILNSNREVAELISDEDSAPDISNISSKDSLSKKGERKIESTEQECCLEEGDLGHCDPCVKDKESSTAMKDTSGVKSPENSSFFDKSTKSVVLNCEEERDNLSSGVKSYMEQDLFEAKDKDPENHKKHNFNSLHEKNLVDLDATLPLTVESESSNDSCKILHECVSQTPKKNEQSNFLSSNPYDHDSCPGSGTPIKTKFATPTKNLSRSSTPDKSNLLSPFKFSDVGMKSPQTPRRNEQSNSISSETLDNNRFLGSDTPTKTLFATPTKNRSKSSTPEKLNHLSVPTVIESLENDLNEDIIVIGGFSKSNENSSPVVQNRSSSSKDSQYDRMSYDFLGSPFHMDDDFNCGFGLSQNEGLHLNTSKERESSSFVSQIIKKSSSPCKTLNELNKTQKSGEMVESASKVDSTNKGTEKVVSSPEIFICDSDGESDLVLNENSFRKYRETKEDPLNCSPITFSDSFSASSKSVCMSLVNDGHRESEDEYKRPNPPEVICCNSSSSEEELSKRILSLKAFKSPSKEVANSLKAVDEGCGSSNIKPEVSSENLESPDSPWVFRVYKPPRNLKESTSTCTAPEDVPSKKKIKNSTSKEQNKSKGMLPATPSTAALKFQISNSPITPLPDFKIMQTPEIKEALKKVGVRALPRKKAVAVLSHIYDETHPWNEAEGGQDKDADRSRSDKTSKVLNVPTKRKQPAEKNVKAAKKKQKANTLSCAMGDEDVFEKQETKKKETKKSKPGSSRPPISSSSSQDSKNMVENLSASPTESCNSREEYEGNLSFMSDGSDSGKLESKEDPESITEYIQSNEDLYRRVLNYVPLNLGDFHQELKENGIKISVKNLMDYLDEQCITFTCPRKEEYKKKQAQRSQRFRKRMIAKLSQQQGAS